MKGKLKNERLPNNMRIEYVYDENEDIIRYREYDPKGHLIKEIYPDGNIYDFRLPGGGLIC